MLAAARRFEDFPIIAETYRDVLRDVMDMEHLLQVLASNQVRVAVMAYNEFVDCARALDCECLANAGRFPRHVLLGDPAVSIAVPGWARSRLPDPLRVPSGDTATIEPCRRHDMDLCTESVS